MSAILYPGSFDPVTKGHIDIIKRLKKIFSRVVVLVADSPRKNYHFDRVERVKLIEEALKGVKGVEVQSSEELTVRFAEEQGINIIARSTRSIADWEYEYAMADANKKLAPQIETLFIMASPEHGFISSSLVREVAAFGGDTSAFVPDNVKKALEKKTTQKNIQSKSIKQRSGK